MQHPSCRWPYFRRLRRGVYRIEPEFRRPAGPAAPAARVAVALAVIFALAARILAVSEAVTGLVLIAWTASYTFFEMRSHWETQR